MRGSHVVAQRKPGAEYAGSEGLHAEVRHRAVIRQGFHQCQRGAGNDTGTRQRQRNLAEGAPGPVAGHSRHFEHAVGLLEESRARQQVNIGIQHQ